MPRAKRFVYEFPRPAVTADVVLFSIRSGALSVLLIKRGNAPFAGAWALPGGFVDKDEALERAALRELAEETQITGVSLHPLGAYGEPGRDPRGHTVTAAFWAFAASESIHPVAADDAREARWHPVRSLPKLAFDHGKILEDAHRAVASLLLAPIGPAARPPLDLVPLHFTAAELAHVYGAVFGRRVAPAALRARLVAQGAIEPVSRARPKARKRGPASLYRWKSQRAQGRR